MCAKTAFMDSLKTLLDVAGIASYHSSGDLGLVLLAGLILLHRPSNGIDMIVIFLDPELPGIVYKLDGFLPKQATAAFTLWTTSTEYTFIRACARMCPVTSGLTSTQVGLQGCKREQG
jgi:hypothetical protein